MIKQLLALLPHRGGAAPIVPERSVAGRTLLLLVTIMAFLSAVTLGGVVLVQKSAIAWSADVGRELTIQIRPAEGEVMESNLRTAVSLAQSTPGVASARALSIEESQALLEPWFGPDLPLGQLPVPQLIEIREAASGFDAAGLRLRLQAEVPGAVLDEHARWRRPLVSAASRLRGIGWISIGLIGATMTAMVTLAAHAALSANAQVIAVLRLVGATDGYIARAFVRRFTLRTLIGAGIGTLLGLGAMLLMPGGDTSGGFLTSLRFAGWHWILPFLVPPLAAAVACLATAAAARRVLGQLA